MHGRVAGVSLALAVAVALAVPVARRSGDQDGPGRAVRPAAQGSSRSAVGDANQFFRRTVTIHKGDSVRWKINGFHNVMFVQGGVEAPPLIVPRYGQSRRRRARRGRRAVLVQRAAELQLQPARSRSSRAGAGSTRTSSLNSGLPLAEGPPPPYKLKFTRPAGSRTCAACIRAWTGRVRVKRRGARIPSAQQGQARGEAGARQDAERGRAADDRQRAEPDRTRSRPATTGAPGRPCSSSSRPNADVQGRRHA